MTITRNMRRFLQIKYIEYLRLRGLLCQCDGYVEILKVCEMCLNTGIPPIPLREITGWPEK